MFNIKDEQDGSGMDGTTGYRSKTKKKRQRRGKKMRRSCVINVILYIISEAHILIHVL